MTFMISFFLIFNSSFADSTHYSPRACTAKMWPFSRGLPPSALHQKFDQITRSELTRYLWFEISSRPKRDLALPMLQYLIETEKDKEYRAYYKLLGAAAFETKQSVHELYRQYPKKKVPVKNKKITVLEVCKLYHRTVH